MLDGGTCLVGPPGGTGEVFARNSANVELDQQRGWSVVVSLSGAGEGAWNQLASECFNGLGSCPSRQLAIVLDGVIQSAPTVQEPSFQGEVSISGNFQEEEARSLARVLNRGAFPVDVEVRRVETVSPTLGQDSMRAAVFAGLVGVAAVLALLAVFYRRLTLLVFLGLCVWGMLIYSISAIISQTTNFALTLAGVTGIVVSIGITVDSYVIYFERLKDDVVHGRTLRNSAARSFRTTWRTILAANLVAFIAAAVLFVLSVGAVRGFALYLGVTTICDVIVLYFFTRPAVILLADTGRLDRRDTFGLGLEPTDVTFTCVPRPRRPLSVARSLALARSHHRQGPPVTTTDQETVTASPAPAATARLVGRTHWRRLILGQTAVDFWGRRRLWLAISLVALAITAVSLATRASSCSGSTSPAVSRGTCPPRT